MGPIPDGVASAIEVRLKQLSTDLIVLLVGVGVQGIQDTLLLECQHRWCSHRSDQSDKHRPLLRLQGPTFVGMPFLSSLFSRAPMSLYPGTKSLYRLQTPRNDRSSVILRGRWSCTRLFTRTSSMDSVPERITWPRYYTVSDEKSHFSFSTKYTRPGVPSG